MIERDDLEQSVLLALCRSPTLWIRYEDDGILAYAEGAARNIAIDQVRRIVRLRRILPHLATEPTQDPSEERQDERRLGAELMSAMSVLTPAQHDLIVSVYLRGKTLQQLASERDKEPNAMYQLHYRALRALRQHFDGV